MTAALNQLSLWVPVARRRQPGHRWYLRGVPAILRAAPGRACGSAAGPGLCGLVSAEGTLFLTIEEAPSRAGEKPKQIGKVSSATYLNKLFIGYV